MQFKLICSVFESQFNSLIDLHCSKIYWRLIDELYIVIMKLIKCYIEILKLTFIL